MIELTTEVWVIRSKVTGHILPPIDHSHDDQAFMAWPTKEAAEADLKYQSGMYEIPEYEVVRLR